MLTRRAILGATAAASIVVIATSHGVPAAEAAEGWGPGFGDLKGGGFGAFQKRSDGFGVFLKWDGGGAEVLYTQQTTGDIAVFSKAFVKGWTPKSTVFLKDADMQGAEAYFQKINASSAEFFVKLDSRLVRTTFEAGAEGVTINVQDHYD